MPVLLETPAPTLWHVTHHFKANGLAVSSRMTVVCLVGKRLWLHSPVPNTGVLRADLLALGEVAYIIAPSKTHHKVLENDAHAQLARALQSLG